MEIKLEEGKISDYIICDMRMHPEHYEDEIYPITDFINICSELRLYGDDDGYGYLCTEDEESDIRIYPSNVENIAKNHPEYKYVRWYSK